VNQARRHVGMRRFCVYWGYDFQREEPPARQLGSVWGIGDEYHRAGEGGAGAGGAIWDRGGEEIRRGAEAEYAGGEAGADKAPSCYAIAARYVLTPTVFECLDRPLRVRVGDSVDRCAEDAFGREAIYGWC